MARTRRIDDGEGDGLDSLLDTMTNVVGILVLVLIATQLGVKDAVNRIAESEVVDAAALDAAREKLAIAKEQRDAIQARLAETKSSDEGTIEVELANLRRQRDQLREDVEQADRQTNTFAMKLEQEKKQADAAKKKIDEMADSQARQEALRKDLNTALKEEARLKSLLDDTPVQEAPSAKVVTLPDPRPAPEGAKQIVFVCSENMLFPVNVDEARANGQKAGLQVIQSKRLELHRPVTKEQPILYVKDAEKFVREFNKRPPRDQYFRIEMVAAGAYPRLVFHPKPSTGENEKAIAGPRSRVRRQFEGVDQSKFFARFFVRVDSFDIYLTTRQVLGEIGLLAGWEPQNADWKYATHLGGPIRFGPPPKPNPNPPAAPAKPTKPPKPPNLID